MKNSIKLFAFVIIGALAMNSCTYENGPKLTLLPKKSRLCRTWSATKVEDNNGNALSLSGNSTITFKKDGTATNGTDSGTWAWGDGKKDVILKYGNASTTMEIKRLTTKELQLTDGTWTTYYDAK